MLGQAIYALAVWLDEQGILPRLTAQANQLADQASYCFHGLLQHACVHHLQSVVRGLLGVTVIALT